METWTFFFFAFSSLFTIINPFSAATMFVSITAGDSKKKRLITARRAAIVSAGVLLVFAFGGTYILNFFSISIDAFRIAGGILITKVGLGMLNNHKRHIKTASEEEEAIQKEDVSIVPLAIPMLSGPGAMTTAIVLMQQAQKGLQVSLLFFAIILVCLISWFILSKAHLIDKYLGNNGRNVVEKLLGLIVLVVGVQFFINGLEGVLTLWNII